MAAAMHLAAVSRCITRGLLTFIASYGWSWLPLTSHNRYLLIGENWGFERVQTKRDPVILMKHSASVSFLFFSAAAHFYATGIEGADDVLH